MFSSVSPSLQESTMHESRPNLILAQTHCSTRYNVHYKTHCSTKGTWSCSEPTSLESWQRSAKGTRYLCWIAVTVGVAVGVVVGVEGIVKKCTKPYGPGTSTKRFCWQKFDALQEACFHWSVRLCAERQPWNMPMVITYHKILLVRWFDSVCRPSYVWRSFVVQMASEKYTC